MGVPPLVSPLNGHPRHDSTDTQPTVLSSRYGRVYRTAADALTASSSRGNGLDRGPNEPLWSVQRTSDERFKVMWGLCVEQEQE